MRKVIISMFMVIFLVISVNVKVNAFQDNQTVDANKAWSIKFSSEVKFDDLTKQGITVTDNNGNKINAGIQLGQDNRTIIVMAPQEGYTAGENYTLTAGTGIHSIRGKALKKEYKLHFNIKKGTKAIENINDLQNYLNMYFSSIDSPIGKLTFKNTVKENDFSFNPYDIRIETEYDGFDPFELEYSTKISDKDKQETIELLKEYQKKIAADVSKNFPDKKVEGGFFADGYEYQYINEGYWQTTFLTWINYDYDLINAYDYKSTHVTNFQWFNLYDDYNFTGEPKRTR